MTLINEEKHIHDDSDPNIESCLHAYTTNEQNKIIRRIDRRLVLTLGLLYGVSLMDRTNTGVAVITGMGVDLDLIGNRYNIIILVFFFTSVPFQPPATIILRKIGPRVFLPTITLLWGATLIGMAFVKTWVQLIPLRLLLGLFESGFCPGCAYLLRYVDPQSWSLKRLS